MRHAREVIAACRHEYNNERPHSALGYLMPNQFAESFLTADSMVISD
jgi:putative transposase